MNTSFKQEELVKSPRFNQELFDELNNMGKEVTALATHDLGSLNTPARNAVVAQSFNGIPNVTGAKNWCGQAACASIIKAWGHYNGKNDDDLMTDIYSNFPPDIFGGACGTSPGRIVEILKAYGLKATYAQVAIWLPGGFLDPANQIAWQHHRSHIEDQWVKKGFPVIVLVDAGMINGPGFQPHWVPYASATDTTATICDSLGSSYYVDQTMNIDRFHEAWEVRFIPNLNFVSLLPEPM